MLKLFILLSCISLLVLANTHALKKTATQKKSSIGAKINAKLAANQTSTLVPLMFVETKVGQIRNVDNENGYPCPDQYTYLSYTDDVNNILEVCKRLPGNGVAYRLRGGASATSPAFVSEQSTDRNRTFRCDAFQADIIALDQALCAKTSIADYQVSQTDGRCPSGYDVIINEEIKANVNAVCNNYLGTWDIVRIGLRGSLSGPGYGCQVRDFDNRGLGGTLCVQRLIQDVTVVSASESNLCGLGNRPVTAQEALANRNQICQVLGEWDIIRIAGGGTFDGPGYGCGVREHDRRGVGGILCAPENTTQ